MGVMIAGKRYDDFTSYVDLLFEQRFKQIYTSMPGIVESYDPLTKRARVRGAIQRAFTDETYKQRSTIVNVPVLHPSAGSFGVLLPVKPGDIVMLHFSMRGLAEFKKTFSEARPTMSSLLSEKDANAVPGYGSLNVTPATNDGISIQKEDGTVSLQVRDDRIIAKVESEEFVVTANKTTVRNLEVLGECNLPSDVYSGSGAGRRNIGSGHKHIYPDPGPPPSQASTGPVRP